MLTANARIAIARTVIEPTSTALIVTPPTNFIGLGECVHMDSEVLEIVVTFWRLMNSNDFRSVGSVLSDDYVLEWPQSNERIRGRNNFAAMNEEYPAHGRWQFTMNRIIGDCDQAVTDVSVTDGVQIARVISFFTVEKNKISKMVEFWPEKYEAPSNRKHLVEPIE